jgi:hypothetical protein
MLTYKQFVEDKKCPPGFKYDKKLKTCVPIIKKYAYYGRVGPVSKPEPQDTNGNGNSNGNGNGNGNGANGNGGNGAGNGSNGGSNG